MTYVVETESILPRSADWVWDKLQQTQTLRLVGAGFVEYMGQLPLTWTEGEAVDLKPKFVKGLLRLLPAGRHVAHITSIDPVTMNIETHEWGGLVQSWDHTMSVEVVSKGCCMYRDLVVIEAGFATDIIGGIAERLYEHRHQNWRRLATADD